MVMQIITWLKLFLPKKKLWTKKQRFINKSSVESKASEMDDKSVMLECDNGIPSFGQFIDEIEGDKLVILIYPIVFCVIICYIFAKNLINLMENAPKNIKPNCISLVSIYPIVSISSLFAVWIPRAYFFCDSVGHFSFMIISYQLYR